MNTADRINPFQDLSDFDPKPAARPPKPVPTAAIDQIAQDNGFPSRQPVKAAAPVPRRRYTTGRNQQINIKATAATIARLYAVADARHLPLGEVLDLALDALERADHRAG